MCFLSRPSGPKYVVLEIAKPTDVERQEAAYRSAYLLLIEDVRMQLTASTLQPRGIFDVSIAPPRVSARARYTTESLHPHGIASFADFERHTPYQEDWQVLHRLSVHPDDVDKAVHVLEKADMEVSTRRS